MDSPLTQLPPLPEPVAPETLRDLAPAALQALSDELAATERAVIAAMAPFERQRRELRARAGQIATEERRRERAQKHASRRLVREQAGSSALPSLADALAAVEPITASMPLVTARAFLRTGGEVHFGFATRPGSISLTDGRTQRTVTTLEAARELYSQGWECGTATVPGVRVHLTGTRIERVVEPDDVVVERQGNSG